MNRLHSLRSLVVLSETGNYRRAAALLGITHVALSRSIKRQEEIYGVDLFTKNGPVTEATVFGRRIVDAARVALREVDEAALEIASKRQANGAHLMIGGIPLSQEALIMPAIMALVRNSGPARFSVRVCEAECAHEQLQSHRIEVYVGFAPYSRTNEFEYRDIPFLKPAVFCRPGHPVLREGLPAAEQIPNFPLIATSVPSWLLQHVREVDPAAGRDIAKQRHLFLNSQNFAVSRKLLTESDMLAISAQASFCEEVAAGRLIRFWPRDWPFTNQSSGVIMTLASRHLSPAARDFIRNVKWINFGIQMNHSLAMSRGEDPKYSF